MSQDRRGRILVVDDEVELTSALCETLTERGLEAVGATSGQEGLDLLAQGGFDILLCDLMMPGMDGLHVLRKALEVDPGLIGIIMTGQGTIPSAVEAMKLGAFDYLLKPFSLQTLTPVLERALETRRLRQENQRLRQYVARLTYESPRYQLVGSSPAMQRVVQTIQKVAPTEATVLIRGASGTGKELVARAIHFNSPRRTGPLVTVNCAALQETLLESELFGHEKGAFTGATQAKPGLVEVAEGGTLFVDEVAEMAPGLQAKLLRVLEDGHYRRVGGTRECRANVRVIAATNRDLEAELAAGRLREDLYYRLNVVTISLPPLCERREDIPVLVEHFLTTRQIGLRRCNVHPDAMQALLRYDWPGNVRELANVLERAQILSDDQVITLDDLPENVRGGPTNKGPSLEVLNLAELERRAVCTALERVGGNKVHAARLLGVSRRALYRLLSKHGVEAATRPAPRQDREA
ncbi:MAG: hypothetical protein C4297_14225 [Gemmataceae bacterium]